MYRLQYLNNGEDFSEILSQMNDIYGEQEHIPLKTFEILSKIHPHLFVSVRSNEGPVGHLIILPFNAKGRDKITDEFNGESDFDLNDFELETNKKNEIFFFVYSLFGEAQRVSLPLIRHLLEVMKFYQSEVSSESLLFAECVSESGVRISEKLGLKKYLSYNFRGEDIHLYQAGLDHFVQAGQGHRSLIKNTGQEFRTPLYQD